MRLAEYRHREESATGGRRGDLELTVTPRIRDCFEVGAATAGRLLAMTGPLFGQVTHPTQTANPDRPRDGYGLSLTFSPLRQTSDSGR